jgi:hypothetical protein
MSQLQQGTKYLITVNNTGDQYIGTYDTTKINLNGKEVYVFKMVYKLVPNAAPEIFARETTFTTNSVTIRQPGQPQPQQQSVLGKRTTLSRDEVEEQEKKRRAIEQLIKASHFLHEMKDKVRNGYTISDIEYKNIQKSLSLIPEEEHYRWANVLESLKKYIEEEEIKKDRDFWESVDGGSRRKGRSKKRKSKRNKRKSKRRKSNNSI